MSLRRLALTAAILLCRAATLGAQTRMPDWSGQWELAAGTPNASGTFEESLDEVLNTMQWAPPNTPQTQAMVKLVNDYLHEQLDAIHSGTDPGGVSGPNCTFGFPMVMLDSPLMFEVLPTPKETVLIFSGREIRHVYTDGRPHTPKDEIWATPWGDSIGHWEGQTLVIDTIAVKFPWRGVRPGDILILAFGGWGDDQLITVLSSEAHFIERIRIVDKDHLEDQMTIIDPANLTAPWHLSRTYRRVAHIHRMVYEDCEGEDRNPVVNGHYTLTPPPSSPPPPLPPTPKSPEGHSR